jgi:hypothetical protein
MSRSLSKREQVLAAIVGVIVVAGGTMIFGSYYLSERAAAKNQIAANQRQLRSMREFLNERVFWESREKWILATQPKLENADTAGVQLLDYVQNLAKKYSIVLENPSIHSPERRTDCISVVLDVETKSAWSPLVSFLGELQSPEQFVALENVSLKVDGADATQLRGRFKIARWYAPN